MPILTKPEQSEEIIRCIQDELYWFKNYVWTFDKPNRRIAQYPLWDYQVDYIKELQRGGLILVEKSRDMMVTWTTALHMLYSVQFIPDWSGFATSRREAEVDDGGDKSTTDSILGMIRFAWEHQPEWLRAQLSFSYLKILNQDESMNSYITGESANASVGRSKSATFKWADEFAFIPQSEKVHAAMSGGAYETLIYTSTSNLTGNAFHRLRSDPNSGFRVIALKWNLRPDRNQEWYERKKKSLRPIDAAKELDIVYDISSPISVYPRYAYETHTVDPYEIPQSGGKLYLTFDEGLASPGAMYLCRYVDNTLYVINEVYQAGIHVKLPKEDLVPGAKDWVTIAHDLAAGEDIEAIIVGFESRAAADIFRDAGFTVWRAGKDKLKRIALVDRMMIPDVTGKPHLLISRNCTNLLYEIPHYERKVVRGHITEQPKDGDDHGCDAISILVDYLSQPETKKPIWVSSID